jgi:hypothetical protein
LGCQFRYNLGPLLQEDHSEAILMAQPRNLVMSAWACGLTHFESGGPGTRAESGHPGGNGGGG